MNLRKKPALSPQHCFNRMIVASHYLAHGFSGIHFHDEKRFVFDDSSRKGRIYCIKDSVNVDGYYHTWKGGKKELYCMAFISSATASDLVEVAGTLEGPGFATNIERLYPYLVQNLDTNGTVHVVLDGESTHGNPESEEWFDNHPEIIRCVHASQSPDMNPIEFLWGDIQRDLNRNYSYFSSLDDFRLAVVQSYNYHTTPYYLNYYFSRLFRNCRKIIAEQGGNHYNER